MCNIEFLVCFGVTDSVALPTRLSCNYVIPNLDMLLLPVTLL
jgi:hypothetical protein